MIAEKTLEIIADIMTAILNCSLYSSEHPAVLQHAAKAVHAMEPLYANDQFSIALIGGGIVSNEIPLAARSIHTGSFLKKMKRKGLERIVCTRGVDGAELKQFITELAGPERVTGSYPHIAYGVIDVRVGTGEGVSVAAVMEQNKEKLKEVYRGVSRYKQLDMVGLEDIVISFISTLRQEADVLRVISPVKSYSEYTYTHNTNVAILSIFQAEALGVKKDMLHEIGQAGLLHDVGKMFISKDILDKPGKLDEKEWEEMRNHPSYGAMYLATLPEVPRIALIAAYEHHMKYNGSGYPDTRKRGRKQHIISQMIAIADFFDALRTERPYHQAVGVPVIVGLLKELSGKEFNPFLVENFLAALRKVHDVSFA